MINLPLMVVKDLVKRFPVPGGGAVNAVNGVSFNVKSGETLAVVGESGCGKTTLARSLATLDKPTSGRVFFEGRDIVNLDHKCLKRARARLQMIFQDPYASLNPRLPAGAIIAEPLVVHARGSPDERRAEVLRLAQAVGLKARDMVRYPSQFSGGQRQRIAIARALALKPALIIADEPLSSLDASVQSQILNLLYDLRDEYGPAFLFISHDLAVVRHFASRVLVMYFGKIVEEALTPDLFANPRHPYTQALIAAEPTIGRGKRQPSRVIALDIPSPYDPPAGCPFNPRCPLADDVCRKTAPELEEAAAGGHKAACRFAKQAQPG